jgi:hypothetical protein
MGAYVPVANAPARRISRGPIDDISHEPAVAGGEAGAATTLP